MTWIFVLAILMISLPHHASSMSSPPPATASHNQPMAYVVRFSDTDASIPLTSQYLETIRPHTRSLKARPETPALPWLEGHGWQKVWPRFGMGKNQPLVFAGPKEARYLRLDANDAHYIWTKRLEIDIQKWPLLEITWGVEQFSEGAALDVHGRSDRPLAIIVSFGEKLRGTNPFFPSVPRGLAFFWGETETVGQSYTCIRPRIGPEDVRMQCRYPHVHYIALRRSNAGAIYTERVNLVEHFQRYFPEYWYTHQRIPPVVGISFEAGTIKTHTFSQSRLYALTFLRRAIAP